MMGARRECEPLESCDKDVAKILGWRLESMFADQWTGNLV
ncbi:hypothetical protein AB7M26_003658 [Pseudomonas sp. F-14 TE3482]